MSIEVFQLEFDLLQKFKLAAVLHILKYRSWRYNLEKRDAEDNEDTCVLLQFIMIMGKPIACNYPFFSPFLR